MIPPLPIAIRAILVATQVMTTPPSSQSPSFVLPAPTGQFGIGTTSWVLTDTSRTESFVPGRAPREVKIFAWYPTDPRFRIETARRAPYLRESIAEARTFATVMDVEGAFDGLASVVTHSYLDEAVLSGTTPLPVLVFSHGYASLASAYTALLEDLASHGYIVLSVAHPYEAVLVSLSNGRSASMLDATGKIRREIIDVSTEWRALDSVMTLVTRAPGEASQRAMLREFFPRLPNTRLALDRWVKDLQLVLDRFPRSAPGSIAAQLARRADFGNVGVLGHSMGGIASGQFCAEDPRCKAGLNLDGIPQSGTMMDSKFNAPFLMLYSSRPARLGANDAIYRNAAARYIRVDMAQSGHIDFSDMNFWGGPLDAPGAHGPITPIRAAELTRLVVREYFDAELKGRTPAILSGTQAVPELTVRRMSR